MTTPLTLARPAHSFQWSIGALTLHYTSALPAERAAARHGIELSNFMRGQKKLEQIAATVEAIKAIDWVKLQSNPLLTTPLLANKVA
ncbi:hypothetical protein [Shewanella sp. NKUCC06_TVS]|uniref:hypothetical protein n=1 Tax=Shewanella sp. NKUCC06_TVS TaxID=2842128 RepID=UPI0031FF08B0